MTRENNCESPRMKMPAIPSKVLAIIDAVVANVEAAVEVVAKFIPILAS